MQDRYVEIEYPRLAKPLVGFSAIAAGTLEDQPSCPPSFFAGPLKAFPLDSNIRMVPSRGLHSRPEEMSSSNVLSVRERAMRSLRQVRAEIRAAISESLSSDRNLFNPSALPGIVRKEIDLCRTEGAVRREKLLTLTGLLYVALELHYSECNFDVEVDVEIARITHDHIHGGPNQEDLLTVDDWHSKMQFRISQLELNVRSQSYIHHLVGFAALAHSALECEYRRPAHGCTTTESL